MTRKPSGIRYIPGKRDLLVISPHSPVINGVFENDARTGIIAENIQQALDCHAIINDLFFKPKGPITKSFDNYFLDLYRFDHSKKVPATSAASKPSLKAAPRHMLSGFMGSPMTSPSPRGGSTNPWACSMKHLKNCRP